jgi:hypothetical protein
MNGINRHNYEAFLLDAIEGRLSEEQALELDTFMALNPDLGIDLEDLSDIAFAPQQTLFPDKVSLKKTESDLVPAEHFIGYIEHQLSPEETLRLEKSCETNPSLAKELGLYQSTIALADIRIVFEDKEGLKHRPKVILFNLRAASFAAAASVAFVVMLYVMWPSKTADVLSNSYAHAGERKAGVNKSFSKIDNADPRTPANTTIQNHGLNQASRHETLLAQNNGSYTATITPPAFNAPDTSARMAAIKTQKLPPKKEPVLMASVSQKNVVETITENEDEVAEALKKKPGFWALAGITLKGLNKAGVKTVDGKAESTKENESYALTLGGMSITHTAH